MSAIHPELKILIVDDYKTMLRIIRNLLAEMGCKDVDEATDGAAAIKLMTQKKYDIVISDWNMEPVTGLDFLKAVRGGAAGDHQGVPFIMVTAESKPENVIAAKKAGVSNYIVKPFNGETLAAKMSAVLSKAA